MTVSSSADVQALLCSAVPTGEPRSVMQAKFDAARQASTFFVKVHFSVRMCTETALVQAVNKSLHGHGHVVDIMCRRGGAKKTGCQEGELLVGCSGPVSNQDMNLALAAAAQELRCDGRRCVVAVAKDNQELRGSPAHGSVKVGVWLNPLFEAQLPAGMAQRLGHADALLECYRLLAQGYGLGDGTSNMHRALDSTKALCEDAQNKGQLHWQFKDHESAKQAMDILDGRGVWDNDRNMLAIVFTATPHSIKPADRFLAHCTAEACYELGGQAPISYVYCRLIAALRADRNSARFLPQGARNTDARQTLEQQLLACRTAVQAIALVVAWEKADKTPGRRVNDILIHKLAACFERCDTRVFTVRNGNVSIGCDEMYVAVLRQCENASSVTPFLQYARQLEGLLKEADIQRFEALYRQRESKAGNLFGAKCRSVKDDVDRLRSRVDVWEQPTDALVRRCGAEMVWEAEQPTHPDDWPCAYD
eukprot:TRINITY_DN46_c0_g1_i7.p1 TRINITY_DN46_c0_g1~~TRINITY_DN46_c0_g1_i7.p1  ORF type:complete len:498 (+),score=128.68 TRINITY_DN46_c0_g1_i7:61-1494(+)